MNKVDIIKIKDPFVKYLFLSTQVREVTEFTSGEGPGIFVRGGENFDKAPPAGGVKFKVAPPAGGEKF